MKLTLTKSVDYNLKPYGYFTIKWRTDQGHLPNIIPFNELEILHDTTMPMSEEQDAEVVKFMKKNKTDILINEDGDYYTRAGSGFTRVRHKKLAMYGYDEGFKTAVDSKYR